MQAVMSNEPPKEHGHDSVDTSACHAKHAGLSDLVICLTDQLNCPCMVNFGMGHFCCHPASSEIVQKSQD